MRHLLKYPKMLLMDYLLTKKLSPKCCFDMSYQEHRCTDLALLKCSHHQMLLK